MEPATTSHLLLTDRSRSLRLDFVRSPATNKPRAGTAIGYGLCGSPV